MTQLSNSHFEELRDWSERKHNLISKYIDSATRILGTVDHVFYIDGFAGRGTYGRNLEDQIPGSPVRAAQLAQRLKNEGRSYSFSCINVESDKNTFSELVAATLPFEDVVINLFGTFSDCLNQILNLVGDKPVLCFLDPFGIDGIDLTAIQKLIRRGGITDFWIRFEAGEVRRRDGYYSKTSSGADRNFDILRRVYGINDDDELHDLLGGQTPEQRKENAIKLYLQVISEEFAKSRGKGYAAAYRIGSLKGDDKYHLVFSSANNKGLNLASDIVYGIEESYQKQVVWYRKNQTSQLSLFGSLDPSDQEIFDKKVSQITEQILADMAGSSITRRSLHTKLVLNGWFGEIKGPHITAALRALVNMGRADISGGLSKDNSVINILAGKSID